MKILVFEYIAGGGFNREDLPASLANEGLLMLGALLNGLTGLPGLDITVMLDWRLPDSVNKVGINRVLIRKEHDCHEQFVRLAEASDAVWLIAPEFDDLLLSFCKSVEALDKILLGPDAEAVRVTADKFKTFQLLNQYQIPTVSTRLFDECRQFPGECIVKPVDGVSCRDSYLIGNLNDFSQVSARLHGTGRHIVQPHVYGKKTSLSCLFKQGKVWLLSANLQNFNIVNKQFQLLEIIVNQFPDLTSFQALAADIAEAIPGLWGYAGIDLIETPEQILVLEINPRLTTSFAGIQEALGINVPALVLQLLQGDPIIKRTVNRPVAVRVGVGHHEE